MHPSGGLSISNSTPQILSSDLSTLSCAGVFIGILPVTASLLALSGDGIPSTVQMTVSAVFGTLSGLVWGFGNAASIIAVSSGAGLTVAYPIMQIRTPTRMDFDHALHLVQMDAWIEGRVPSVIDIDTDMQFAHKQCLIKSVK